MLPPNESFHFVSCLCSCFVGFRLILFCFWLDFLFYFWVSFFVAVLVALCWSSRRWRVALAAFHFHSRRPAKPFPRSKTLWLPSSIWLTPPLPTAFHPLFICFFFKYFCTPIYCVSPRWTRLDRVLLGFYRFYLVLLGFTGFYWVLLGFTWCYLVLPSFNLVLPRFYLGFTGF